MVEHAAILLTSIDPMSDCPALTKLATCCPTSMTGPQLTGILSELMACLAESGASGGSGCLLCGTTDPVDAPSCDCAKYYRTDTGEEWNWNDSTSTWDKVLE